MEIGNIIDVNVPKRPGWRIGTIYDLDKDSGQVRVMYHNSGDNRIYWYWIHLNNPKELAPFMIDQDGISIKFTKYNIS